MSSGVRDGRPPTGLLLAGGFAVTVLACAVVAAAVPGTRARVWVMAAVVTVFAARARSVPAALVTALTAWCFTTGFLVNAAGTLTFGRSDLVRLGVFAAGGLAGVGLRLLASPPPVHAQVPVQEKTPVLHRTPR